MLLSKIFMDLLFSSLHSIDRSKTFTLLLAILTCWLKFPFNKNVGSLKRLTL